MSCQTSPLPKTTIEILHRLRYPGTWVLASWLIVFSIPWILLTAVILDQLLDRVPTIERSYEIPLENGWVATVETTRTIRLTESTRLWIQRGNIKRIVLALGDVISLGVEKDGNRIIVTCEDRGGVDLEDHYIRRAGVSAGAIWLDVEYVDLDVPEHRT